MNGDQFQRHATGGESGSEGGMNFPEIFKYPLVGDAGPGPRTYGFRDTLTNQSVP